MRGMGGTRLIGRCLPCCPAQPSKLTYTAEERRTRNAQSLSCLGGVIFAVLVPLGSGDNRYVEFPVTHFSEFELEDSVNVYATFNANGGSATSAQKGVGYGEAVGALPTASRSNYRFDGWSTEQAGGSQVTASNVLTNDETYYAH